MDLLRWMWLLSTLSLLKSIALDCQLLFSSLIVMSCVVSTSRLDSAILICWPNLSMPRPGFLSVLEISSLSLFLIVLRVELATFRSYKFRSLIDPFGTWTVCCMPAMILAFSKLVWVGEANASLLFWDCFMFTIVFWKKPEPWSLPARSVAPGNFIFPILFSFVNFVRLFSLIDAVICVPNFVECNWSSPTCYFFGVNGVLRKAVSTFSQLVDACCRLLSF